MALTNRLLNFSLNGTEIESETRSLDLIRDGSLNAATDSNQKVTIQIPDCSFKVISEEANFGSVSSNISNAYLLNNMVTTANELPYIMREAHTNVVIAFSNLNICGDSSIVLRKITTYSPLATTDVATFSVNGLRNGVSNKISCVLAKGDMIACFASFTSGTKMKKPAIYCTFL